MYYLGINGETAGPFNAEEITSRWSNNELKDAFIYDEKTDEWVPISERIEEIFSSNNKAPLFLEKKVNSPNQYTTKAGLWGLLGASIYFFILPHRFPSGLIEYLLFGICFACYARAVANFYKAAKLGDLYSGIVLFIFGILIIYYFTKFGIYVAGLF